MDNTGGQDFADHFGCTRTESLAIVKGYEPFRCVLKQTRF